MGLTKQYLRYVPTDSFNLISSINCNICFIVYNGQEGRYVAVGACEYVYVWDLRLGEKALVIPSEVRAQATYIAASPDRIHLAIGYSDGKVGINNMITGEWKTTFAGHRSPISCLAFDKDGHRLASGSMDTEIVTWDLIVDSGLQRLSGHKGPITGLVFMKEHNIIISSSKDGFIKFWDMDTSHCFHTIPTEATEIWSLCLAGDDEFVAVGTQNNILVWNLESEEKSEDNPVENQYFSGISIKKAGTIQTEIKGRIASMVADNTGRILSIRGTKDRLVESFMFLTKQEALTRSKKRQKKQRDKKLIPEDEIVKDVTLQDYVRRLNAITVKDKVRSVATVRGSNELRICVSLSCNKLEMYSLHVSHQQKKEGGELLRTISGQGHQGEVRAVSFSSDSLAIASVGSSALKLWNRASLKCLRTIELGYAVSVSLVPGDRNALVGMKDGHILVVDISAGEVLEEVPAHSSDVWAIQMLPDKTGAVSCSSDSTVKMWQFELVKVGASDKESAAKVLSIVHRRTLKLDEGVLAVRVSPCSKLVAAALLDKTVKIFFMDTFKFFLSLYGHTLPVTCVDISSDSALLVTGSGDRNVKLWDLDHGNCLKSLFAHDDTVTSVLFVPNTHYFFSAGKDGKVKEWDGDSFNKIITLEAHFGECWGLALTKQYVASCGSDRMIRLFEKTEEPLVLNDEEEEEREKAEELATGQDSLMRLASVKTVGGERSAELLMECIEEVARYREELEGGGSPALPPLMAALRVTTTEQYLERTLNNIKGSDLGEALLLLPFHLAKSLLRMLPPLLKAPTSCEVATKTMMLLLKMHFGPISADPNMEPLLNKLRETAFSTLKNFREVVGVNLYGLKFIQKTIEEKEGITLFKEASTKHKERTLRKRKKEIARRSAAILKL